MSLDQSLKEYKALLDQSNDARFAYIRHILLMASGLLGILVSLYKKASIACLANIAFSAAVLLISAGILFLSIALFENVAARKALRKMKLEDIRRQIHQNRKTGEPIFLKFSKVYQIFEIAGYVSFVLAVICLSIYIVLQV